MKKLLLFAAMSLIVGCSLSKEVVDVYKGDPGKDGTSCSVAPEMGEEQVIGARISCTDGSFSVIYNGQNGAQGIQGIQGLQGIQGPVGEDGQDGTNGTNGQSCQAYRTSHSHGVYLSCPDQHPLLISDGKDGDDGKDGSSCSSVRQEQYDRVRITCGNTVSYVYDGQDGKDGKDGKNGTNGSNGSNGTSCTVTSAPGGANIKCGDHASVFLANGAPGAAGTNGSNGRDGLNGTNGEDAVRPGLSCNVHNLASWDGITNITTMLANNPPVGSFTLNDLSVGDSQASLGFPGMPANLQALVGVEGYALDCVGYLNTPTSGAYNFSSLSDDGLRIIIEGQTIVNDPSLHAPTTDSASNVILNRGPNRINVVYYQGPLTQIALQLKWSGPNTSNQVVPASAFTHQ